MRQKHGFCCEVPWSLGPNVSYLALCLFCNSIGQTRTWHYMNLESFTYLEEIVVSILTPSTQQMSESDSISCGKAHLAKSWCRAIMRSHLNSSL